MDAPKVGIVTPIHNAKQATDRYLASVEQLSYPDLITIVVDDGSTDGSAEMIAQRYPDVVVIPADGSLWWAAASNLGAREALRRGARFIFTCNNDVILDPDVITSSVECALAAGDALVGAVVLYEEARDRVWFAGARLDPKTADVEHDTEPLSGPMDTRVLTGMGMLIPADVFVELDGFDQSAFPHYLADCDFSLRAYGGGHRLLVTPSSKIYNDVSSAWSEREFKEGRLRFIPSMLFSMRSAYWISGRVRFYRRHWGPGWAGALVRLYRGWFRRYAWPLVRRRIGRLIRRNAP